MHPLRACLTVMLCAAGAQALAAPPRPADPRDPAAPAPPLVYASAFAGYQPGAAPKARSWQESNAAVGQQPGQGGHAMHGEHGAPGMHGSHGSHGADQANDTKTPDKPATPPAEHKH